MMLRMIPALESSRGGQPSARQIVGRGPYCFFSPAFSPGRSSVGGLRLGGASASSAAFSSRRLLLLGVGSLLPLLLDGGHLRLDRLLLRCLALLYVAAALAQILLAPDPGCRWWFRSPASAQTRSAPDPWDGSSSICLSTGSIAFSARGHGAESQFDIGLARAGLIRHRIDRVENLGVLIQRVVDQDRAARPYLCRADS